VVVSLFAKYNGPLPVPPPKPALEPSRIDDSKQAEAAGEKTEAAGEQAEPDNQDETEEDGDSGDEEEAAEEPNPPPAGLTPELDAEFGKLADERIARHRLRYYVVLPVKRAASMWFDTHSQYYPFEGALYPLSSLDRERHQQYWLPAFVAIDWLYTLLAGAGCWLLFRNRDCRRWLLMIAMLVVPRLTFLSTIENPEPRYVVELFSFVAAVAALPLASLAKKAFDRKPVG
jgi:hypothetical protein